MANIISIDYAQPQPQIELQIRGTIHRVNYAETFRPSVTYTVSLNLKDTIQDVDRVLYEEANYLPLLDLLNEELQHEHSGTGYIRRTYCLMKYHELKEAKPHLFV